MLAPVAQSTLNVAREHLDKLQKTIESAHDLCTATKINFDDDNVRLSRLAFDDRPGTDPRELALRDAISGYGEAHSVVRKGLSTGVDAAVREMDTSTRRWLTFRPLTNPEWWRRARPKKKMSMPLMTAEGVSAFCILTNADDTDRQELLALHCAQVGGRFCLAGIRVAIDELDPSSKAAKQAHSLKRTDDVMFPTERRDAFFVESTYPLVEVAKESGEYLCHFLTGVGLMASDYTLFLSGYRVAFAPLQALFGDWKCESDDANVVSCFNVDCHLQEACGRLHALARAAANNPRAASWCNPDSDRLTGAVRSSLIDMAYGTSGDIAVDMNDTSVQGDWIQIRVTVDHGICLVIRNGWGLVMAVPGHRLRCTRIKVVREKSEADDQPCTISMDVAKNIPALAGEHDNERTDFYLHGQVARSKIHDLLQATAGSDNKLRRFIGKVEKFENEREEDIYWCGRTTPGRSALKWPLIVTPISSSAALNPKRNLRRLARGDVVSGGGERGGPVADESDVDPSEDSRYLPVQDPLLHALADTEVLRASCGSDTELRFDAVAGAAGGVLLSVTNGTSSIRCARVDERYRKCVDTIREAGEEVNPNCAWSNSERYLAASLALEEAAASTIATSVTKRLLEKTLLGMRVRSSTCDDTVYLSGARHDTGVFSTCNYKGRPSIGLSTSALVGDNIRAVALNLRQWITEMVYPSKEKDGNTASPPPSSMTGTSLLPPSMASVPASYAKEYVDRLVDIIHRVPNPTAFACMLALFIRRVNEQRPKINIPPTNWILSDGDEILDEDDEGYEEKLKRVRTQNKHGRIVLTGRDVAKMLTALSNRGIMTGIHNTVQPCNCGKDLEEGCPWMVPANHWLLSQTDHLYGCGTGYVKLVVSGAHLRRAQEEEVARRTFYWMRALTLVIESFDSQIVVNNLPLARATEWYCNTVVRNRILDLMMMTRPRPSSSSDIASRVQEMSRIVTDDAMASATLFHSVHNALDWTPVEEKLRDALTEEFGFGQQHPWQASAPNIGTFIMRGLASRPPAKGEGERPKKLYALHPVPKHVSGPYFVTLNKSKEFRKPRAMGGNKYRLPLHTTANESMCLINHVTGSALMTTVPQRVAAYRTPFRSPRGATPRTTAEDRWEFKNFMRSDYLNEQDAIIGSKTQRVPLVTMGALYRPRVKIRVVDGEEYVMKDVWCGMVALNRSAWMDRAFGCQTGSSVSLWTPVTANKDCSTFEMKCMASLESQWKTTVTAAPSLAATSNISRLAGPVAVADFLQQKTPVDLMIEWDDGTTTLASTGCGMAPTCPVPGTTQIRTSAITCITGPSMVTVPHRCFMFAFNPYCQQTKRSSSNVKPPTSTIASNVQLTKQLILATTGLNRICVSTNCHIKKIRRKLAKINKNRIGGRVEENDDGENVDRDETDSPGTGDEDNDNVENVNEDEEKNSGTVKVDVLEVEEEEEKKYDDGENGNRRDATDRVGKSDNDDDDDDDDDDIVNMEQKSKEELTKKAGGERSDNGTEREEGEIYSDDSEEQEDEMIQRRRLPDPPASEGKKKSDRIDIGGSALSSGDSPFLPTNAVLCEYNNRVDIVGGDSDNEEEKKKETQRRRMPPPLDPVRKKQKTEHNKFNAISRRTAFSVNGTNNGNAFCEYDNIEGIMTDLFF
uniref:Wsv151-like protein n=2 Tax=Melicertus latisulcatus pemonivirus TaxID=2984278 RepID=A0A9C7C8H8_9VIRU|nr:MAG: wsv151-like protein [Melicertus latisulcatus pemonivirus]